MSPMRLIILLVAAGAAIAAVFLVRSAGAPKPAAAAEVVKREEAPTKQILVAKNAIPIGKFVAAEDLKWQAWPESSPTGAFIEQTKVPEGLEKTVGAVAVFDLVEGEPVTLTKLVQPGDSSFLAAMLSPGTRATSIEISPETAAGGFILPNDRVDVLVIRELAETNEGGSAQKVRADLLLTNIRVLAIDGIYAPLKAEGENATGQAAALIGTRATLEVAERDVVVLNAAKKAGELALSLRSITDMQGPAGATGYGRAYRAGAAQSSDSIRIYRYGNETVATAPAG